MRDFEKAVSYKRTGYHQTKPAVPHNDKPLQETVAVARYLSKMCGHSYSYGQLKAMYSQDEIHEIFVKSGLKIRKRKMKMRDLFYTYKDPYMIEK